MTFSGIVEPIIAKTKHHAIEVRAQRMKTIMLQTKQITQCFDTIFPFQYRMTFVYLSAEDSKIFKQICYKNKCTCTFIFGMTFGNKQLAACSKWTYTFDIRLLMIDNQSRMTTQFAELCWLLLNFSRSHFFVLSFSI